MITVVFLSTPLNADYSWIARVDENDAHSYHKLEQIPAAISWIFLNHWREGRKKGRIIGEEWKRTTTGLAEEAEKVGKKGGREREKERGRQRSAETWLRLRVATKQGCSPTDQAGPRHVSAEFPRIFFLLSAAAAFRADISSSQYRPLSPLFFRSFLLAAPLFSHLSLFISIPLPVNSSSFSFPYSKNVPWTPHRSASNSSS